MTCYCINICLYSSHSDSYFCGWNIRIKTADKSMDRQENEEIAHSVRGSRCTALHPFYLCGLCASPHLVIRRASPCILHCMPASIVHSFTHNLCLRADSQSSLGILFFLCAVSFSISVCFVFIRFFIGAKQMVKHAKLISTPHLCRHGIGGRATCFHHRRS